MDIGWGTDFETEHRLHLPVQTPLQRDRAAVVLVVLRTRALAVERCVLLFSGFQAHACQTEYVRQERPGPGAVAHRTVIPVDAVHLLDDRAHCVAAVSGALECGDHGVLRERAEGGEGQLQCFRDITVDS